MTDNIEHKNPMRVLRVATTASLSGRSELTYQISCSNDNEIFFRVTQNSSAGMFSNDWISMAAISKALSQAQKITSATLQETCYSTRSQNSGGFLLGCLVNEKLIASSEGNERNYQCLDPTSFLERVNALIASNVELADDATPIAQPPDTSLAAPVSPKRAKSKKV